MMKPLLDRMREKGRHPDDLRREGYGEWAEFLEDGMNEDRTAVLKWSPVRARSSKRVRERMRG